MKNVPSKPTLEVTPAEDTRTPYGNVSTKRKASIAKFVADWLAAGMSFLKIRARLVDDYLKFDVAISTQTASRIINEVQKDLKTLYTDDEDARRGIQGVLLARLDCLYQSALDTGDVKEARLCISDITSMLGLRNTGNSVSIRPDKIEITFG